MQNREEALKQWLQNTLNLAQVTLIPLAGDASFRRYYRLSTAKTSYIIMDAPPTQEALRPFLEIGLLLKNNQILTPTVHAFDEAQGFALLEDFGDTLLLSKIRDPKTTDQEIDALYLSALSLLAELQPCHKNSTITLPVFDKTLLHKELNLFKTWFLEGYLNAKLTPQEKHIIQTTNDWLVDEIAKQPQVFVHRDYHSRNIMVLDEHNTLGLIDFQDGLLGPVGYDLVSLLKDCYIQWPTEKIMHWLKAYYLLSENAQQLSLDQFKRAFELCGLQRHLKVLGIFSRLFLRDDKANYLADLPLTRHYVMACLESYPALHEFYTLMETRGLLP